jgi:hypothetical protein
VHSPTGTDSAALPESGTIPSARVLTSGKWWSRKSTRNRKRRMLGQGIYSTSRAEDQKQEIDADERGDETRDEDEYENENGDELSALPNRDFSKKPTSTIHHTDQSAVSVMGTTANDDDDEDLWCCCRIIPDSLVRCLVYVLQLDLMEERRAQREAQRRAEQGQNDH